MKPEIIQINMSHNVTVYAGDEIAAYGFGNGHPFGPDRFDRWHDEFRARNYHTKTSMLEPVMAGEDELKLFHTEDYIEKVKEKSVTGTGFLDYGDTPAFQGVFEAASSVAGSVLDGTRRLLDKKTRKVFVPIAGLHHASPERAGGFCVFNDVALAAAYLIRERGFKKVAYVDIDAHHGDGVYYGFEDIPELIFADIHQNGIYPGTGSAGEKGTGRAAGFKLNIPVAGGSDDEVFRKAWDQIETFLREFKPEFYILQAGTDSIKGDPITWLSFTSDCHFHAAQRLCLLADETAEGRLIGTGGGGYNRTNLAQGWNEVIRAFIEHEST